MEYDNDETMYCRNCGKLIRLDEMRYRKFLDLGGDDMYSIYFLCVDCNAEDKIEIKRVRVKAKK